MKLVSYNIQYTKGRDRRFDTMGIDDLLQGADVIALQEVERNRPRSGMTDQVADLDAQARSTHINMASAGSDYQPVWVETNL